MDPATARRRFFIWIAIRLSGLAIMGWAAAVYRSGQLALALVMVLAGGATLLLRPRHIGLSTVKPPEAP
jgi:uncharacterized membrane protein